MKKIFINTNYFLRLLLKDNKTQFEKAYHLFQQAINQKIILYTSLIVIFEIYWVLFIFYKKNKKKIVWYLEKILKMSFIEIENREILLKAIDIYKNRNIDDFEDCYNLAYFKEKKLSEFLSFDKKLLKFIKKI